MTELPPSSAQLEGSPEWDLLDASNAFDAGFEEHDYTDAPLMTRDAYVRSAETHHSQYGLMGKVLSCHSKDIVEQFDDPRLYLNTNAPFSAVVCGVQGSGKSHTVSIMLESMLIAGNPALGSLEKPLTGLVLHFGEGGRGSNPCEAAWIGLSDNGSVKPPPVKVFVSKSSLATMIYASSSDGDEKTQRELFGDKQNILFGRQKLSREGPEKGTPSSSRHRRMYMRQATKQKGTR